MVSKGVFIEESFDTFLFMLFPIMIKLAIEWSRTEKLKAELLAQTKSSEIALLRSQINPHFLFNTLNNIYSLVYQKSELAPSAVMKLSEIMRYMLYDTNADKVPLSKELNYIKSYIELQELRINKDDFVKYEINGDIDNKFIAPMMLISFIENAFKHCSKKVPSPGIIIKVNTEEKKFIFELTNYVKKNDEAKDKEGGIGLHNLQRRLDLIYPSKHKLEIKNDGEIYFIHLELED
jgi:LytS/YehU family sensor histidine kinase